MHGNYANVLRRRRFDTDVAAYEQRILAAGSTISATDLGYLNDCVVGLKTDGIWSSLLMVWPCLGSSFAGGMVLLKNRVGEPTSMANAGGANFGSGDYSSLGLQGNGSTKWLTSGVDIPTLSRNDVSWGIYCNIVGNTGAYGVSPYEATGDTDRAYFMDSFGYLGGTGAGEVALGSYFQQVLTSAAGFKAMTQRGTGSSDLVVWENAAFVASTTGNRTWQQAGSILFYRASAAVTNARLTFAFVGTGLSNTQLGNLRTRVQALQVALGRQA